MASWRKLWSKITESEDVNDMPDDSYRLTASVQLPPGFEPQGCPVLCVYKAAR